MAAEISWPPKDPSDVLDYTIDWNDSVKPVLESGESISTSTWTVPSGITKDSDSKTSTKTTIVLSGGTAGTTYEITNTIVTDNTSPARTYERSVNVEVRER